MNPSTDEQPPANRGDKRGWGVWIALAVAGLALVVLMGLPGFLAAGFSRVSPFYIVSVNGEVYWGLVKGPPPMRADARVETIILAPAGWLMMRSESVRKFYNWEFNLARGVVAFDVDS